MLLGIRAALLRINNIDVLYWRFGVDVINIDGR